MGSSPRRKGRQNPSRARTSSVAGPSRSPRSRPATARPRCRSAGAGAANASWSTTALAVPCTTFTSTEATPPRVALRSMASGVFTPRNFGTGRSSARTPGTLCRHAKYATATTARMTGTVRRISHDVPRARATGPIIPSASRGRAGNVLGQGGERPLLPVAGDGGIRRQRRPSPQHVRGSLAAARRRARPRALRRRLRPTRRHAGPLARRGATSAGYAHGPAAGRGRPRAVGRQHARGRRRALHPDEPGALADAHGRRDDGGGRRQALPDRRRASRGGVARGLQRLPPSDRAALVGSPAALLSRAADLLPLRRASAAFAGSRPCRSVTVSHSAWQAFGPPL